MLGEHNGFWIAKIFLSVMPAGSKKCSEGMKAAREEKTTWRVQWLPKRKNGQRV